MSLIPNLSDLLALTDEYSRIFAVVSKDSSATKCPNLKYMATLLDLRAEIVGTCTLMLGTTPKASVVLMRIRIGELFGSNARPSERLMDAYDVLTYRI